MVWFLAVIALILLISLRPVRPSDFAEDYISPQNCGPVKGLFTLLIVPSHFVGYLAQRTAMDLPYTDFRSWLGQGVVCMFLFYSGYGVMCSIRRMGLDYVRSMPRKRLLIVLLDMVMAVMLFVLLRLALGQDMTVSRVLLSCIGWEGLGNSNWYIHVILVCYLVTWLVSLLLKGQKPLLSAVLCAVLLAGYAVFMQRMGKDDYWYNTILIYPLGMAFAVLEPKLHELKHPNAWWFTALAVSVAGTILLKPVRLQHMALYWLWDIAFTAAVLLLSMKIRLKSPILEFFGRHIFSIYMLQRLPMLLLNRTGAIKTQPYACLALSFAFVCLLAVGFDEATGKLHRLICPAPKASAK